MIEKIVTFARKKLLIEPSAKVLHFNPGANGLDRFGNRMFTSPDLAYSDNQKNLVKAGVLLSKKGEKFLISHPGIIGDIDAALDKLGNQGMAEAEKKKGVQIGKHRLRYLVSGGQSNVYILEIGKKKYIVKTHIDSHDEYLLGDRFQPYINEMLQIQNIGTDLKDKLRKLKVKFPNFLLASGQACLVEFEEGEKSHTPNNMDSFRRFQSILRLIGEYVNDQISINNPLWKNIQVEDKYDDFIERKDSTLVFIDPFAYSEKNR